MHPLSDIFDAGLLQWLPDIPTGISKGTSEGVPATLDMVLSSQPGR